MIKEWAGYAEIELRIHAGLPLEHREEANKIVHNAVLGMVQKLARLDIAERMELLEASIAHEHRAKDYGIDTALEPATTGSDSMGEAFMKASETFLSAMSRTWTPRCTWPTGTSYCAEPATHYVPGCGITHLCAVHVTEWLRVHPEDVAMPLVYARNPSQR